MHNLKTNFDKILNITKFFFEGSIDTDGNYFFYPRKPKMSDCEVIALSLLGETIGIDSENYLIGKIKSDHYQVSSFLNEGENIYLVDSIPIPICKNARKTRSKICLLLDKSY